MYLRPLVQGWRIDDPGAGASVIRDIVVHDVDALRFALGSEPREAMAMTRSAYVRGQALTSTTFPVAVRSAV